MKIEKSKFKENSKYLVGMLCLLGFLIIFSLIFNDKKNINKIEIDLEESDNSKINKLVINEISNNNDGSVADSEGNIYDWIELYNGSNKDINLLNYTLSDSEEKIKWAFGDVTIKSKSYLVIFTSGETRDGLYTNFKINKNGGERIVLRNPSSKIIDAVDTVKTNKNTSLARGNDGSWNIVKNVTPGFSNTKEGLEKYLNSLNITDDDIQITEILVRNGGQFKDDYNEYSGYIELKNNSDKKINLKGYSLSDNSSEPFKWGLPEIELGVNEYIMIYTSGRDIVEGILHTNFKLNSKNGNVILSKNGKIVQDVNYENLPNGYALQYNDGMFTKSGVLTGGFANDATGAEAFAKKYETNKNSLIINEVMNSNYEYLVQNSGNYYDWIELKNNSDNDINLKDYYLTTTLNDTSLYQMPDVVLKPNEYYIIMASGDINLSNTTYQHCNFKLSSVESLYLISNNKVVDSLFVSDVPSGYSYGRKNDYGFYYMEKPSPMKENNSGKYEVAYSPEFSVKAGIYNDVENIQVELIGPGTIYYTLDGKNPTTNSKKYEEPIILNKTSVLKAISVNDGMINSSVSTASYIINENHTIDVVSVSLDPNKFDILNSAAWDDLEYPAYVEYFDSDGGFSIPCGIKLFGGSARGYAKKSFSLKFRKKYGQSELHYQVFENRDNSIYKTLVLRSGSQDLEHAMIRDPLMTSIVEDTEIDVQAMKPIIVYINGNYWGVYYIIEKVDENFVSAHYNVPADDTNVVRIDGEVSAGSNSSYYDLINYLSSHDMSRKENYDYVSQLIDIDNMIKFWISETYITNNDIINCRVFSNPNIDNGKWHFIFYDLDFGMYYYRVNYYNIMNDPEGMGSLKVSSTLTRNLFKNDEFRKRFVELLSEMLENTWTEEKILSRIDELYNEILPEMPRNFERWGGSMDNWNAEIEELRKFARNRKDYLLAQTKSYFNLSSSQMKEYFNYEG